MRTWKFFSTARKVAKDEYYKTFGNRSKRSADYFCQDPTATVDHHTNPLDWMIRTIELLIENGEADTAMSGVRILAAAAGCELKKCTDVVPDKDSLLEEIVDDMPALVAYQNALQGNDLEAVDRTRQALIRELEEDRVSFIEEKNK